MDSRAKAVKINLLIIEASDACYTAATAIRALINEDVCDPKLLGEASGAADELDGAGKTVNFLTLEEDEY